MGKTTNILDLNNRLTKVEKENVAQNSYTSLRNKPKINNVTLTGNKSLADLGAAAAADLTTLAGDVGDKTRLNTTDKSSTVAAINEVNGKTSVTHSTVSPSSNFFVSDWTIDKIGNLRLLEISQIKDLAAGSNTVAQLSADDIPNRFLWINAYEADSGKVFPINITDTGNINIVNGTGSAITGTLKLFSIIAYTV